VKQFQLNRLKARLDEDAFSNWNWLLHQAKT